MIAGCYYSSDLYEKRLKYSYARIIQLNVPGSNESYDVLRYCIDSNVYTTRVRYVEGYVLGDVFVIEYDSLDPAHIRHTLTYKPVFLDKEKRGFTIAKVVVINKNRRDFGFDYTVNCIKHRRYQYLEKVAKYYPILSKNALYLIEYWFDNPQRSIIYHNQPIVASQESIATVSKVNEIEESDTNSYYSFVISSDSFSCMGRSYRGICKGDKFKMVNYITKDKEINPDILYAKPIFLRNEKIDSITAEIVLPKSGDVFFSFIYVVDGIKYTREQAIDFDLNEFKQKMKHRKKNTFKAVYWVDNPQRAIIYLDRPLD